jgi:superfamily I DNA and/or RNA helicase
MHPSIAQLVRDTLYSKLQDHRWRMGTPTSKGLARRLFWLDHRELEAGAASPNRTSASHLNASEVEMTTALVSHHVWQCKYKSDNIAMLTPYLGQLQKLRLRISISDKS